MLASTLGWNIRDRPLKDLEQCLLYPFTGDISRDGDVLRRLTDLIDLVDKDDPSLRLFDVVIGCHHQFQQQVLDILPDISRLGEGGRIPDGKGDIEGLRQCASHQRFSAPGRADEEDV